MLVNKKKPNKCQVQKLKKDQREPTERYQKELEYIQGQINKIRNLVEDRHLKLALKTK